MLVAPAEYFCNRKELWDIADCLVAQKAALTQMPKIGGSCLGNGSLDRAKTAVVRSEGQGPVTQLRVIPLQFFDCGDGSLPGVTPFVYPVTHAHGRSCDAIAHELPNADCAGFGDSPFEKARFDNGEKEQLDRKVSVAQQFFDKGAVGRAPLHNDREVFPVTRAPVLFFEGLHRRVQGVHERTEHERALNEGVRYRLSAQRVVRCVRPPKRRAGCRTTEKQKEGQPARPRTGTSRETTKEKQEE